LLRAEIFAASAQYPPQTSFMQEINAAATPLMRLLAQGAPLARRPRAIAHA